MIKTLALNGKALLTNNKELGWEQSITLPPYTIRLRFTEGYTPTFSMGTGVQLSESPNIWDLTYENNSWSTLLMGQSNLLEVLGANVTNVTNFTAVFRNCTALTNIALFDTSNASNIQSMFEATAIVTLPLFNFSNATFARYLFEDCRSLITIPNLDFSNITDAYMMFYRCYGLQSIPLLNFQNVSHASLIFAECHNLQNIPLFNMDKATDIAGAFMNCWNIQSGILNMYQYLSTKEIAVNYHSRTFYECGSSTTTGRAELAQIPSDWK